MAKLTTKARKAIPTSQFSGPDRSYPVMDRSHAANVGSLDERLLRRRQIQAILFTIGALLVLIVTAIFRFG